MWGKFLILILGKDVTRNPKHFGQFLQSLSKKLQTLFLRDNTFKPPQTNFPALSQLGWYSTPWVCRTAPSWPCVFLSIKVEQIHEINSCIFCKKKSVFCVVPGFFSRQINSTNLQFIHTLEYRYHIWSGSSRDSRQISKKHRQSNRFLTSWH